MELKIAIARLDPFSMSVSRLMIHALSRVRSGWAKSESLVGFKCETYDELYFRVACENGLGEITSGEHASRWRQPVLFTRLLSRASGNGHSLPATRHVKASPRVGVGEKAYLSRLAPELFLLCHPLILRHLFHRLFTLLVSARECKKL